MPEIRSSEDWWGLVDQHWADLLVIVFHHLDFQHRAYEVPGSDKSPETGRTVTEELDYLRKQRTLESGRKLARYFNAAWGMASESYAWSVPGWGVLCDLCSEEWVLEGSDG